MADFYQSNITWPNGDPNGTGTGSAAWYWNQVLNVSSGYYDAYVATNCKVSSPCYVPLIGEDAAPDLDQRITALETSVNSLTGGKVQVVSIDLPFYNLVVNSLFSAPGNNPMPWFNLAWAPDYPDPTDYVNPLYLANGTYGFGDAMEEQLTNSTQGYWSNTCTSPANIEYWAQQANNGGIPNDCQGAAFQAMQNAMAQAATQTNNQQRVFEYWQAESIANNLALYLYWGQNNAVPSYASWINGNSLSTNVTQGGVDTYWFDITGNGIY
jgi:hypothetical protein